ncbi:MAG: hypothetical protein QOI73_2989 [Solirubrobacteraceae bacterium]|nr:hypothetical protein [Solirubrobacteraceae bacterium]
MQPQDPALDECSSLGAVRASELVEDAVVAGVVASVLSGVPSTAHALLHGDNLLEASLAAGTLLLGDERRPSRLLPAALLAHGALSVGWALVLAAALPRRRTLAWSAVAGLAIAALDLGVIGRRYPRIRALPLAPQVLDHLAYAATVACVLNRRRARRPAG